MVGTPRNKATELKPEYAVAFSNRGAAYADKSEDDRAIADYNRATELDAKYVLAYHNPGVAHERKGDDDCAIADFARRLRSIRKTPSPAIGAALATMWAQECDGGLNVNKILSDG